MAISRFGRRGDEISGELMRRGALVVVEVVVAGGREKVIPPMAISLNLITNLFLVKPPFNDLS